MIPYEYLFEENARHETRNWTIKGHPRIPDGEYVYLESYCPDPECDCQMVLFRVFSRRLEAPVSTFSCGFASEEEKYEPELEPYGHQSPFTSEVLDLVVGHLEEDPAYVERLKTHYQQVKSVANDPHHPLHERLIAWREEIEKEERKRQRAERKQQPRKDGKRLKVPQNMQSIFEDIADQMDEFCRNNLDDECSTLARQMVAALARKRPSPLKKGKSNVWACGILYAEAQTNFLFDKSQSLHTSVDELCDWFGASKSTAGNKARQIRDALKIGVFDPKWCLPSLLDENPLVWMVEVDGLIVDIRTMPRAIQEVAYRRGIIPYIPADK